MSDSAYTVLGFETEIFGQPVWRLNDVRQSLPVVQQAKAEKVLLISYRETGLEEDLNSLIEVGFYQIEKLTQHEKQLTEKGAWPDHVRLSTVEDACATGKLAQISFTYDRYHMDDAIPNDLADECKKRWAYNSVEGRADAVFLYEEEGQIIGFNACMIKDGIAIIDLIGVHPDHQGKGIGKALVQAMVYNYFGKAKSIQLGTQENNISSQAFYASLGFEKIRAQTTWHWSHKS